jgi:pseudouridine-5'-phosphate glycosidase
VFERMSQQNKIKIARRVARFIKDRKAVVALESTVIAHGLPHPLNIETMRECQFAIISEQAMPAITGIVAGRAKIGLNEGELEIFASGKTDGEPIEKVGLNNLAAVMAKGRWGATTVAGSMKIASLAGLRVFSTGGIGGVHRGAETTLDISSDLTALASIKMICVCAGAKAILDLPKTLERLETFGIPVIGYQTDELPAFYSRRSSLRVDARVDTAEEAAMIALTHWQMGGRGAVRVCAPAPDEFEIPSGEIEQAIEEAIGEARAEKISGKAVTPFVLSRLEKTSGGRTLAANRALLVNNARLAARIAQSLARIS